MSGRTFKTFPQEGDPCPICNSHAEEECFLVPIDGTQDGNICEAAPVHTRCIKQLGLFRMNKDVGIIYCRAEALKGG